VRTAKGYQASLPQILGTHNQAEMAKQIAHTTRRAEAQADAQFKKCNPDYEAPEMPEEEDVSNLYNGVFIGDDTIAKLASIERENGPHPNQPRPRWWKWLLSLILGSLLMLLALWLYKNWFPPGTGDGGSYTIIAEPWKPPT